MRNQLIINQSIEQTVLIEDRAEGSRFMHGPATQRVNVKMCFTFAEGTRRRGRALVSTTNGGINDSPIDEYQGHLRMQADREEEARYVLYLIEHSFRALTHTTAVSSSVLPKCSKSFAS